MPKAPAEKVVCHSGDPKLDAAVNEWLRLDKNEVTLEEVKNDIKAQNWGKLRKNMMSRQKFGTAGMRGRMAAGFNCMNDVVILQTAQGLLSYLKKQSSHDQLEQGIVIGYDGRHNSMRFAKLTARVFINVGIPVQLYCCPVPTPLVSFATTRLGAAAGVMVTASHNPKEDNGYKVYWSNGSQIISPHDDNLIEEISQNLEILDTHWNISEVSHDANSIEHDLLPQYMTSLKESLHAEVLSDNKNHPIDIVYSAMHGTGYRSISMAFEECNLKPVVSVLAQQEPDGDFPTVQFPNPEEPPTLDLGKQTALEKGIRLLLVNDPDADRLAVAEYDYSKQEWKTFTGNEMGALLGWWCLHQYRRRHPDASPEDVYVLASVVSSKMLRAIVKGKGQFVETLTGFKWMGNTALLLQQQGKVPVFAFEEAIGYMCHPVVPDKDGVSAAVYVASLATNLYAKGSSLKEQLGQLYKEYGYHITYNSYFICDDQAVIQTLFRGIRNYHGPGIYPKTVGAEEIEFIHDLKTGHKEPQEEERHLNVLGTGLDRDYTSGEMVMMRTRSGLGVTVRTSGTEPKLKYYTELVCPTDAHSNVDEEEMRGKLKLMVDEFIENLLQPSKHGLKHSCA